MKRDRRGTVLSCAVLMLTAACASAPTAQPPAGTSFAPRATWSYTETLLTPMWWYSQAQIGYARAAGVSGAGRRIAILDTGVLAKHEDLPNVDGGAVTCGGAKDTNDVNGHGTQLAGIALGRDPGRSTRGVAPDARLVPIKIGCGLVTATSLTAGVDRALVDRPDIVLLAIGGYPAGQPDVGAFLKERIARNPDVLFVVASTWDGVAFPLPDWTRADNVLVVGGTTLDNAGSEIAFSARGSDLWAPARDVETADIEPDGADSGLHAPYMMQGTSAASAIVAGCAALVKEKTGHAGARLKTALLASADVVPTLAAGANRRLNCGKAVQ